MKEARREKKEGGRKGRREGRRDGRKVGRRKKGKQQQKSIAFPQKGHSESFNSESRHYKIPPAFSGLIALLLEAKLLLTWAFWTPNILN